MSAWNGWYHVNGNTYGTWLPGDKRGWRSRHHKQHVDGDYKNPPPPGTYDDLHEHAKGVMGQPAVVLNVDQRRIAGEALVEMLLKQEVEVLALSVDAVHFHLLARFGDLPARAVVGRAKKHATFTLQRGGHRRRVWGKRARVLPIKDRAHQVNVFRYILSHATSGAWTWRFESDSD
ncbi:hypothetical protein LCGC14_0162870 [marine sediment metagenome]|uniref:Transposase IS200-like domain-containing protein n=1 Tax=marine sediment metagenome TaxID=412755 RepID=A0A0F9XDD3_9ZZZZ|nr:hypothetical protein [Phycisphaerae bacterium]HDZ44503.1 hypothetical protein [Phycisphaerae bacterium]